MALDWTEIQQGIFDAFAAAIVGVSPLPVIAWQFQSGQPAVMPPKPCILLNFTKTDGLRNSLQAADEVQVQASAGTQKRVHHRAHSLSVNVYSDTTIGAGAARSIAGTIERTIQSDALQLLCGNAGFRLALDAAPVDLSALLTTRAESRTLLTFSVWTLDSTVETTGYIQTVPLTGVHVAPLQT